MGITSGWDAITMRGYATGPLLESLTGTRQTIQGVPVGEQTLSRFLLQGVHLLADSYERHGGDMDLVTVDVSVFLGSELAQFAATQPAVSVNEPDAANLVDDVPAQEGDIAGVGEGSTDNAFTELKQGDTGERVGGGQQVLIEQGYLRESDISVGCFGTATAETLYRLQGDQVRALQTLENQPSSIESNTHSESSLPIGQRITDLLDEH